MKWLQELLGKLITKPVSKDVCAEIQKRNAIIIKNLDDRIHDAISRTADRFKELKEDMKAGFTEVKELIKNGRP